jgi:GT2 family glycosyltransferase
MIFVYYFFAAVLVFFSLKSFRGGLAGLAFYRFALSIGRSRFAPKVTIIAPCRGVDDGLGENLRAIAEQDYPDFEIIFVVDDPSDPAVGVIDDFIAANSRPSRIVVAPKAVRSGQKVENLREAVEHAARDSEIFVFVDSDIRPSTNWLGSLVAPLEDPNVGAAAGYRWFISKNPTLATELRSAWNASIASALGPNTRSNFCWGGSTSIRRETFERLGVREKWKGTVSDDFVLTDIIRDAGLQIVFVPQALVASIGKCTFREMLEFTTRQMKITRVYAPRLWLVSLFGSALFNVVMISSLLIGLFAPMGAFSRIVAIVTLISVSAANIGKSFLRLTAVKFAIPEYGTAINRQFWTQSVLWLLTPAIFACNGIAALFSRRVSWRGTTYELKSKRETVIIAD